ADPYDLVIFHEGPLAAEHQALLAELEDRRIDTEYRVLPVDVSGEMRPEEKTLYEKAAPKQLPWLHVLYPGGRVSDPPAYSGPLSAQATRELTDSPLRREIARQILQGESVVWLLLESGDRLKDQAAARILRQELERLEGELALPELDAEDEQYLSGEGGPELKLSFSLLTLARENQKEKMLVQILENWDPELSGDREPMAFALFGRGRVLGPLVGDEIHGENLEYACGYLTGACSCQIKRENPGWDMLMRVDWEGVIQGYFTLAEALPRLTTLAAVAEQNPITTPIVPPTLVATGAPAAAPPAASSAPTTVAAAPAPPAGRMGPNVIAAVAVGIVFVALASLVLRRGPRDSSCP
ncbi:MAG: hypothetical protein OER86_06660, partial [Phycisphaerae bacterium]|nr:hypothetical protein [Phycisphaerae bacterium]